MASTPEREPTNGQIALALAALLLLIAGGYALYFGSLGGFVGAVDHCERLFCDFELHFQPVGASIFAERRPVTYFIYPPFAALLFGILGFFDHATAYRLWGAAQLVGAVALFALARPNPRRDGGWLSAAYLVVFATSVPLLHNTKWGQVSVFVTAAMLGSLELHRRGRRTAAALLLAVAAAVKLYPAIFALVFALRRDWRSLAVFGAALLAFLTLVPIVVLGWHETWAFYDQVATWLAELTPDFLRRWNTQYVPAALSRVLWHRFDPESAAGVVFVLASWGLVLANGVGLLWLRRRGIEPLSERAAIVSFLVLPLLLPVTWPHYLVFLPYCQLWLTRFARCRRGAHRALPLAAVAVSALLASVLAFDFAGHWIVYARAGTLAWADLVLLAGFWFEATAPTARPVAERRA